MVRLPWAVQVVKRLAQEARRTDRAVVNAFADFGLHHLDDSANQRTRRVILAAVAPGVAHVLDLGFVKVRQLVLFGLRAEAQFVDVVDDLAQVVAAVDPVLDLAENLADLVFDGVRAIGFLLEAVQVGKQLAVDEVAQIVAGQRLVVVQLAVRRLWARPSFPSGTAASRINAYFLPSSSASMALSCSSPSRYFRNSSHEVCSV